MKTLIFNGSPRKNGDTVGLINEFIKELDGEYKIVNAYYCDIKPCIDCTGIAGKMMAAACRMKCRKYISTLEMLLIS